MPNWQPIIETAHGKTTHGKAGRGPIYLAVAEAIGQAIARGDLTDGERLPPQRALAERLGVDLTTISRAYAEAARRGLVEATVGRGTFVRAAARAADAQAMVDMTMNLPPQPPELRALLQEGLAGLLARAELGPLLAYRAGAGSMADRAAGADWLAPLLGQAPGQALEPSRLLVCAGAQCALVGLLTLLARPGDALVTDALTYPGLRGLAGQLGLRLVAADADADGMLPEAVDRLCREVGPKAIYCMPTMHNPVAVTMPPARRQALAEVALRHAVPVIEDDAYGLLPSHPLAAVTAAAAGVGYYIGTVSKCLTPALRVAYVVAGSTAEAARVAAAIRATSLVPPPLMAGLMTRWVHDGSAARILAAIRAESVARQRLARGLLPAERVQGAAEGLHLWLTLPAQWNRLEFCMYVRGQGLALVPSDAFAVGAAPAANAVRISLGAAESAATLETALGSVAAALRAEPPLRLGEIV